MVQINDIKFPTSRGRPKDDRFLSWKVSLKLLCSKLPVQGYSKYSSNGAGYGKVEEFDPETLYTWEN